MGAYGHLNRISFLKLELQDVTVLDHFYGVEARDHIIIAARPVYMYKRNGEWHVSPTGHDPELGGIKVGDLKAMPADCDKALKEVGRY